MGLSLYEATRKVVQHRRAQCHGQRKLINGAAGMVGDAPMSSPASIHVIEAVEPAHRPIEASVASDATYLANVAAL